MDRSRTPVSAFVTTYNNAATLGPCLEGLAWADELVVLDSFSTDATCEIARAHGARIEQHRFLGYGAQKQLAMEMTRHDWVFFLDADEMLPRASVQVIEALRQRGLGQDGTGAGEAVAGYELPRIEQVFWRMSAPGVRHNRYLRLFRKSRGRFSHMPVHAAPEVDGPVRPLAAPFYHFGEPDIHTKVEKINHYSSGLVADKLARGTRPRPWVMVLYPPLFFFRSYVLKRGFLNGWAGFVSSAVGAFYAFLKYAKLYEHHAFGRYGTSLLPPEAPPPRRRRGLEADRSEAPEPARARHPRPER